MSNNQYDGSVKISTEFDINEYKKSLQLLERSAQQMTDNMGKMFDRALDGLKNLELKVETRGLENSLNQISQAVNDMTTQIGVVLNQVTQQVMDFSRDSVNHLGSQMNAIANGMLTNMNGVSTQMADYARKTFDSLQLVAPRLDLTLLTDGLRQLTVDSQRTAQKMALYFEESLKGVRHVTPQVDTSQINAALKDIKNQSAAVGSEISGLGQKISNSFRTLVGGLGLAVGAREFIQLSSVMTDLESRARIAANGMMEVGDIMHRLREIADAAYSPLEATATAFMNNSTALNDIGMSMKDQLDMTDALTNALVVSGAKGHQFELVMNAINRSLAVGKMAGRDLEMVMKYGGKVAEGMAQSLGTTVNGLKDMAREGKLTSKVLFEALIANLDKWKADAESMPATISDALVRLQNQITSSIGDINRDSEIATAVVKGIDMLKDSMAALANHLPMVVTSLAAFAVVKTNVGKAAAAAASGMVSSTMAIKSQAAVAGRSVSAMEALKQSLTGVATGANSQINAWQALKVKITGDTSALVAHTRASVADAKAAQSAAANNVTKAEALQRSAAAEVAAAASAADRAVKTEALTQRTREYTAALEAKRLADDQVLVADMAHAQVAQAAAVENARVALAENERAIAQKKLTISMLEAVAAQALQNGNMAVYQKATKGIIALQGQLAALTAQQVTLTNSLTAAQRRLNVVWGAATKLGKGLLAMVGGPWGIAFIAATAAITKLMTRQSEAEKFNEKYAKTIEKAIERLKSLKVAVDDVDSDNDLPLGKMGLAVDKGDAEKDLEAIKTELQEKVKDVLMGVFSAGGTVFTFDLTKALNEQIVEDFKGIVAAAEKGAGEGIKAVKDFSDKYYEELNRIIEDDAASEFARTAAQNIMDVMSRWGHLDPDNLLVKLDGVDEKIRQLDESLIKSDIAGKVTTIAEAMRTLEAGASDFDIFIGNLRQLGVDVNALDFSNFYASVDGVTSSLKTYNDRFTAVLNDLKLKHQQLGEAINAGIGSQEDTNRAKQRYEELARLIKLVESKAAEDRIAIWAKAVAEIKSLEEEMVRGVELTEEEKLEIEREATKNYIEMEYAKVIAAHEANAKALEEAAKMQNTLAEIYQNLAEQGFTAGYAIAAGLSAAGAALQTAADDAKGAASEAKNAMATALKNIGGQIKLGGGGGGGGGGSAADSIEDVQKALREVELTLARMQGNRLKVIEIESLQELERFTELLGEAGIAGEEAARKLEEFKEAQAIQSNKEIYEEQIAFYEKIKGVVPEATEKYEELRQKLLELEAIQLRQAGIPDNLVDVYVDQENISHATDAMSGLRQAVRGYLNELTPAKAASDFFSTSVDAMTDALTEGIWNAKNFGDAMANMCNTIIQALQRMAVEMLVVRPIMQAFEDMLGGDSGGGGGGLFGFLKSLFGVGHSGGIVGQLGSKKRVSPLAFLGAPEYHAGGIAGLSANEIPIIAKRGEMIITQADQLSLLKMIRNGFGERNNGTQVNVQVINQTSVKANAETKASQNPNGGLDLQVFLTEIDKGLANKVGQSDSSLGRSIQDSYQLNAATKLYRNG
jgi:tape measure domain-containing protein